MNRKRTAIFCLACCLRPALAQPPADRLPIKRVVLYKNGVGYFEHLGAVRNKQDVTIAFTSGQLNDVLKSLTVLDLNGGHITGVSYGSSAPADKQLGDLRLPVSDKSSLAEFLGALRGARVEIRNGTTAMTGRLLSVERKTRITGGNTLEIDYVSLIADSGEVRTAELSPSFSVKLLEKDLSGKVNRFLDIVSSTREADVRKMVLSTDGAGDRSLFVSYISEVPVWKATYRVVLGKKAPLLQGWAIVDNTVGQDWENVQLSLVAGAPQSFIQNLSQPYYARRPVVGLPQSVSQDPQTFESTLILGGARVAGRVLDASGGTLPGATIRAYERSGALVSQTAANPDGAYQIDVPEGVIRLEISAPGFQKTVLSDLVAIRDRPVMKDVQLQVGSATNTIEVRADATMLQTSNASLSSVVTGRGLGNNSQLGGGPRRSGPAGAAAPSYSANTISEARAASQVSATAQELGDLFEYKLKEPVTITKNHSALVPIVQTSIGAEKVSVWNEFSGSARPQRALWLTNSSGLTLDGGSFSVLEEETFAGEGIFEPIRPDEKRLVSYATDLALTVNARQESEAQRVSRVTINHGVMTHHSELLEKKTYTFRNQDTSARTVIIEHPVRGGYELRGKVRPDETTAAWMRFRVRVEPKQTVSVVVEEARPVRTDYALSSVTTQQVELFLSQRSINPAVDAAVRRILDQKCAVDELEEKKDAAESAAGKIFDNQQRIRENMKSLKGSAEEKALVQRYTRQLNDEEDRIEALRKEAERYEEAHDKAEAALNQAIEDLAMDVSL